MKDSDESFCFGLDVMFSIIVDLLASCSIKIVLFYKNKFYTNFKLLLWCHMLNSIVSRFQTVCSICLPCHVPLRYHKF